MRIVFSSSHMRTLSKLQELADKHNCRISFGVDHDTMEEVDFDILKAYNFTEEMIKAVHTMTILPLNPSCVYHSIWFELFDRNTDTYHTLSYHEDKMTFSLDCDDLRDDVSDEWLEFLTENSNYYNDGLFYYYMVNKPTYVSGFGFEKLTETDEVYRSGMALKFFGDRVCDYLGEPRIEEVY